LVTPEDWIYRWRLRLQIKREITNVVQKMIEEAKGRDSEFGPHDSTDIRNGLNVVPTFFFPVKTWSVLMEDTRLPKFHDGQRILYELEQNRLTIRELASPAHDAAANALNTPMSLWCTNIGALPESVRQLGHSSNILVKNGNIADWYYVQGSEKSPDQSFRPRNILTGPNLAKVIPGTAGIVYPTFTVEVGKTHESYPRLLDDAEHKHFSPMTSVQVWLGIKLHSVSARMQLALKVRDNARGHGSDPAGLVETPLIDLQQPTNLQIIVPKVLIFFAVPPPLPPTSVTTLGPNCLPPQPNPGAVTDDFVINVETIREQVADNWA
jgi:hypothetical protein